MVPISFWLHNRVKLVIFRWYKRIQQKPVPLNIVQGSPEIGRSPAPAGGAKNPRPRPGEFLKMAGGRGIVGCVGD